MPMFFDDEDDAGEGDDGDNISASKSFQLA